MRLLIVLAVLAVVVLALLAWEVQRRRRRARQWAALPARWTVEVEECAGVREGDVFTEAVLYLVMPNGDRLERSEVTSTLYTAEHPEYVQRVADMRGAAQERADARNLWRRRVEDDSRTAGRLTLPADWKI